MNNNSKITIRHGKRADIVIDLQARAKKRPVNSNTGVDKYCPIPHPFFKLSESALPHGANPDMIKEAASLFSCSIAKRTQANYATAVRHLVKAEQEFGRKFSSPMIEEEKLFLMVYLLKRKLKKELVLNYLSAIKFYQMAQGNFNPADNSELALRLVTGAENRARDPQSESARPERRPITASMVLLLGFSIASSTELTEYEK